MNPSRRMLIAALGSAPILSLVTQRALAAYPDRPIHLIVPFAAGGNADIVGRITGDLISKALGQPVVVENRGGGGGSIGAEFVAHATPDGYTLLVGSNGPLTVDPLLHANLGYDPLKDFTAVALTSYVPHALILSKNPGQDHDGARRAVKECHRDNRHQRHRQRGREFGHGAIHIPTDQIGHQRAAAAIGNVGEISPGCGFQPLQRHMRGAADAAGGDCHGGIL